MNSPIPLLSDSLEFPDPRRAQDGLVAIGGDMSVPRLLEAYRQGIFPWTADPLTWWSPDPRGIFELGQFHVPRSLAAELKKGRFQITFDRAFRRVIQSCAWQRRHHTWIAPDFVESYSRLHEAGHAHSVECWLQNDLAGGVYGVAIGGFFAGESMFHRADNASKVALCHLVERLRARGFALFDIQMVTPVTEQLGAKLISRDEYLARLKTSIGLPAKF